MENTATVGNILECSKCKCPIATLYMPCASCGHYETTPP